MQHHGRHRFPVAKKSSAAALGAFLVLAIGCAPGPHEDAAWPEPRPLGRDLEAFRPPSTPELTKKVPDPFSGGGGEPTGMLTLRDALAAALLRSPDLAATAYEVRPREAEVLQAGLPPNPELEFELEDFAGTAPDAGFDMAEATLALSQVIELGGKRVKRQRVAAHEAQSAGWDYEIRRIDVLSKTGADFIDVLAAERRLLIARDTTELAQRVHQAVSDRVDAGKVPPVDRAKADVELAQAEVLLEQAERAVVGAQLRLASNWGSIRPGFEGLTGDLNHVQPPPALEVLLDRVEQNPDLARWTAEAALRQAELELALAQRTPDVEIAGGVRYFNEIDEFSFVAGVSVPLQVFDRNQGNILAARLRAIRDGHLEDATRVQICTAIAGTHQVLDAAFVEVFTTRDRMLPSAELAFTLAEEAFRQGKIDALNLFDAQRTLFDARRQLVEALTSYHLAVLATERLTGAPLHDDDLITGDDQ